MLNSQSIKNIKPTDLPAPPEAAIKILHACSQDDVSSTEISKLAATDPVLTAELLRVVNSPFFGMAREVQSINHAIAVLGYRALRNLVLCISVRDALHKDDIPGLDMVAYWEDSLRRAVSARLLGEELKLDKDECFTAGLLQDFGLLVMFFLQPDKATQWPEFRSQDPDARYAMEQTEFMTTHDQVGLMLAQTWSLPETLTQALGYHHHCQDQAVSEGPRKLCHVLYCADWMAAVYSADDKGLVFDRCRQLLSEHFAMNATQSEACLAAVPEQVEQAANSLGLHVEQQQDFDQVLRQANTLLAKENLSYQELTWKLENTLKERDRLATELNKELELAKEIQRSLLPQIMADDFPITGINVSARELSGDFYDFFQLDDGRIYFNLGDVSGKGINAALLMAKTSSLFRCLGKREHNPSKLMAQINNEICETSIRGMFITMVAGLYTPSTGQLCLINAGNPPALLFSGDGKLKALEAQAPPLGVLPGCEFPVTELDIKGGSLYIFSDGVTEGYITEGEELGIPGLVKMLLELKSEKPQQRLDTIVTRLNASSLTLRDDITLLLIEGQ